MFTQRRGPFSRSAAIAVMLGAMVLFAGTSRVSADSIGISFIDPNTGNLTPVVAPAFSPLPSGLSLPNPNPTTTPTNTGFTISNMDYTISNSTLSTLTAGEGSSLDVQWKASRRFSVANPISSTLAIDASILITTSGGSVSGTLTLTAFINTRPLIPPATTLYTLTAGPSDFNTTSWENSLNYTLGSGNYTVILQSDLKITSIDSLASVKIDDTYDVSLAPEPSSWLLFTVLCTTLLAGRAGQQWLSRRRRESTQCAASLGG